MTATALALSACSGGDSSAPGTSARPRPEPSTSSPAAAPKPEPKPKPERPEPEPKNPFTGIGPVPSLPTVIAKIDDTAPGRPQVGIDRADIVYIEEAEGGLSRLAAVFGTHKPVVGYVRSTRPSDPELFLQYGKITEAASGGGGDSLPKLDHSGIRGWINDRGAHYYRRVSRSQSTYINLVLNLRRVAGHTHTPGPRSVGLRFSNQPGTEGVNGKVVHTLVGSTPVTFTWWPKLHRYVRFIDGRPQRAADGTLVSTANVVVQRCKINAHPQDRDVLGNPSQFTHTVGAGKAAVFRNGREIRGFWHRKRTRDGTRFSFANGHPITLAPGNTWIALVRPAAPATGLAPAGH
jgi:Protein of unknown function (DUF3048) N-terminal domain/Protein of unknown function (DUF3048) C-terminal domain